MVRPLLFSLALLVCGCPKNSGPSDAAAGATYAPVLKDAEAPPRTPDVDDLWRRAKNEDGGAADDLARLARREGVAGLIDRGQSPELRRTAAFALGYTDGFYALAWLGQVATEDDDEAALAALTSAVALAGQPRKQRDAEDAEEIKVGCDKLLSVAKNTNADRRKRVLAVRALRMLSDKGCAKEIPGDVDAH